MEIRLLQVSAIWTEVLAEVLKSGKQNLKSYWVSEPVTYRKVFDALNGGEPLEEPAVGLPWLPKSRQRFWSFYGDISRSQSLSGNQAWRLFVPFRVRGPLKELRPSADCMVAQESFLFPHAIGLVIRIKIGGNFSLEQAVDRTVQICRDPFFEPASGAPKLNLHGLAEHSLALMRERFVGTAALGMAALSEPFVIVSILEGTGDELFQPVEEQGPIHRALQGLATLSKTWRINKPYSLSNSRLPQGGNTPAEHFVYATKNGRVIWHPRYYSDRTPELRAKLNCYHRNQMFAALQIKSQLELVTAVHRLRKEGQPPVGAINDLVRYACGHLGRLYGGDSSVYRSWSPKRQLMDAEAIDMLNVERQYQAMSPMHD